MDFSNFLKIVPKIINTDLLGHTSHSKMAPPSRRKAMELISRESFNPRKAAVLILIYPKDGKSHMVLIIRNNYKGVHSSQIAFPGGKRDINDKSLEETALRETFEEIGISSEKIVVIRPLTSLYIPPSDFLVYPYLGYATHNLNFVLDSREVAGIIEWPIADLLNDKCCVYMETISSQSIKSAVPAFLADGHFIWGATAMILNELKDVLKVVR